MKPEVTLEKFNKYVIWDYNRQCRHYVRGKKSVNFGKVETIFEPIIEGEAEIFGLGW